MINSVGGSTGMNDMAGGLGGAGGVGSGSETSSTDQMDQMMEMMEQMMQEMMQMMQANATGGGNDMDAGGAPGAGGASGAGGAPGAGGGAGNGMGSGNLIQAGQPLVQQGVDKALKDFSSSDSSQFQAFESDLSAGNGNAAEQMLATAVQSGGLSQGDAQTLEGQINSTVASVPGGSPMSGATPAALQ